MVQCVVADNSHVPGPSSHSTRLLLVGGDGGVPLDEPHQAGAERAFALTSLLLLATRACLGERQQIENAESTDLA